MLRNAHVNDVEEMNRLINRFAKEEDLAEIKSVAVDENSQKQGIGRELVQKCFEEGKKLGINRLFVLTYIPEFFEHMGFKRVDKELLPHKIWTECVKCYKFPDCGEVPLMIEI
jgi:amino-acid N-acetyltransferase